MNWFTSRYTQYLEQQVRQLTAERDSERAEVRRLTSALVPSLQRMEAQPLKSAGEIVDAKKGHKITKAQDQQSASCLCGWRVASDDAVELQQAISTHYKESFVPLKSKSPSWVTTRARLEADSAEERNQA